MKRKPVKAKNILGEVRYYPSTLDAAKDLGTETGNIRQILTGRGNRQTIGRYAWRFWEITQEQYENTL